MKRPPLLLRATRMFFGFLRGFIVMGAILQLFSVLIFPLVHLSFSVPQTLAEVSVKLDPKIIQLSSNTPDNVEVKLSPLSGSLWVTYANEGREFSALSRWHFFLCEAEGIAFSYLLFDLLYRLCRKIEDGEIFSSENTRLVRNIGLALVGFQALVGITGAWYARVANRFLEEHIGSDHLQLKAHWYSGGYSPSISLITTGCLVILLAEVFRQGLILKTENDLTV